MTDIHPAFKHDPYWNVIDKTTMKARVAEMIDKGGDVTARSTE